MPTLATKLYLPPLRHKVVLRPRLVERLNEGLAEGHKLTLISASAGFGKTTLLSEWVNQKAEGGRRKAEETLHPSNVAWLSLDEGDNDPIHFLTYLVAALQTLALSSAEGTVWLAQKSARFGHPIDLDQSVARQESGVRSQKSKVRSLSPITSTHGF